MLPVLITPSASQVGLDSLNSNLALLRTMDLEECSFDLAGFAEWFEVQFPLKNIKMGM